jgi:hypothetical protein
MPYATAAKRARMQDTLVYASLLALTAITLAAALWFLTRI